MVKKKKNPITKAEEEEKPFHSENTIDYFDEIERLFASSPDKRKKKEWKEWQDNTNKIIAICNKMAKMKIYNIIK